MLYAYKGKKLPKVYNDVKKEKKEKKPQYVMYTTRRLHAFYMGKYELSFSKKALQANELKLRYHVSPRESKYGFYKDNEFKLA